MRIEVTYGLWDQLREPGVLMIPGSPFVENLWVPGPWHLPC